MHVGVWVDVSRSKNDLPFYDIIRLNVFNELLSIALHCSQSSGPNDRDVRTSSGHRKTQGSVAKTMMNGTLLMSDPMKDDQRV